MQSFHGDSHSLMGVLRIVHIPGCPLETHIDRGLMAEAVSVELKL